ncbi:MAG: hypothetical protein KGV44_14470 [Flavobacteriaceae bacterium]|nr:hypothetical protein [Flavobacteriaceae bacterium]
MKKLTVTMLICLAVVMVGCAPILGLSKKPYRAIDDHTYQIGEVIQLGKALDGKFFRYIITRKLEEKVKPLPSDYNNYSGAIQYFKNIKTKSQKEVTYALIDGKEPYQQIFIPIDFALAEGELKSLNPYFKQKKDALKKNLEHPIPPCKIKSFDDEYELELLSCKGNKNSQTVTITFRVKQEGVHKKIEVFSSYHHTQAYDTNGTEYNAKEVAVGSNLQSGYSSYNKIPTGIPIQFSLTFHKILPKVQEFSFLNIFIKYGDYEGYYDKKGSIEIRNLKIDWGK